MVNPSGKIPVRRLVFYSILEIIAVFIYFNISGRLHDITQKLDET